MRWLSNRLVLCAVATFLGASPLATAEAQRPDDEIPATDRPDSLNIPLIEAASARLIEIQEADGAWPYEGVYRVQRQIPVGYRIGGTAIVCLALLDAPLADRTAADRAIGKGVELILQELEHPLMKPSRENTYDVRVWGHIYALDLFVRLETSGRFDALVEKTTPWIEKLVDALVEQEIDGGGWNYANRNQHASFVTAPALQALISARSRGSDIPQDVFDRGVDVLNRSRASHGAYRYSGTRREPSREEPIPGSIARNVICESTLQLLGHGDEARLQSAIDAFYEHWDELEKRRKKTGTHEPPYGIAPYYFYYGHRYLAQGIALLPAEKRAQEYARFERVLLQTKDADDTWNDRVFDRSRAFGTAMSVLALSRQDFRSKH
ncbi:MAG TPA: hypothetical protein PKD54_01675 [Pirellulaceae bacterium]|nr:hypothetical protein [Pirellulaceae bacterium]